MKSFKEYFLYEMSQEIENIPIENIELAKKYFNEIFQTNNLKSLGNDLYLQALGFKSTEFIVYSIQNEIITGAVQFEQRGVTIHSKEYYAYSPIFTISFGRKNFMELSYKTFSTYKNSYILSDKKQTPHSKKIWKKWYLDFKNSNTPEVFVYNIDNKEVVELSDNDVETTWCKDPECRKYRIVIKF